jgi:hypothetical protein
MIFKWRADLAKKKLVLVAYDIANYIYIFVQSRCAHIKPIWQMFRIKLMSKPICIIWIIFLIRNSDLIGLMHPHFKNSVNSSIKLLKASNKFDNASNFFCLSSMCCVPYSGFYLFPMSSFFQFYPKHWRKMSLLFAWQSTQSWLNTKHWK